MPWQAPVSWAQYKADGLSTPLLMAAISCAAPIMALVLPVARAKANRSSLASLIELVLWGVGQVSNSTSLARPEDLPLALDCASLLSLVL